MMHRIYNILNNSTMLTLYKVVLLIILVIGLSTKITIHGVSLKFIAIIISYMTVILGISVIAILVITFYLIVSSYFHK